LYRAEKPSISSHQEQPTTEINNGANNASVVHGYSALHIRKTTIRHMAQALIELAYNYISISQTHQRIPTVVNNKATVRKLTQVPPPSPDALSLADAITSFKSGPHLFDEFAAKLLAKASLAKLNVKDQAFAALNTFEQPSMTSPNVTQVTKAVEKSAHLFPKKDMLGPRSQATFVSKTNPEKPRIAAPLVIEQSTGNTSFSSTMDFEMESLKSTALSFTKEQEIDNIIKALPKLGASRHADSSGAKCYGSGVRAPDKRENLGQRVVPSVSPSSQRPFLSTVYPSNNSPMFIGEKKTLSSSRYA
jgi:hypothetical protein